MIFLDSCASRKWIKWLKMAHFLPLCSQCVFLLAKSLLFLAFLMKPNSKLESEARFHFIIAYNNQCKPSFPVSKYVQKKLLKQKQKFQLAELKTGLISHAANDYLNWICNFLSICWFFIEMTSFLVLITEIIYSDWNSVGSVS